MSDLTRIDAIRIIENITDKDDPAWEWAVEDFYDEDNDTMPSIYDVLNVLGVSEAEYKEATGAQNTKWPEVELDYAVEKETEIDKLQAQLAAANARVEALEFALTPSVETKAAYWGERTNNWTLIKGVMADIKALAAARGE